MRPTMTRSKKLIGLTATAIAVAALTLLTAAAPAVRSDPAQGAPHAIRGLSAADSCTLDLFEEDEGSPQDLQKRGRYPASLGWATSAVWHRERLLLADNTHDRFVTAELTGKVGAVDFTATDEERRHGPSFIAPRPDGGVALAYFFKEPGQMGAHQRVFFADVDSEATSEARIEGFLEPKGRIFWDRTRNREMVSRGFFQAAPTNDGLFLVGGAETREPEPRYVPLIAYADHEQFLAFESPLPDEELRELSSKTFVRDLSLMAVAEEEGEPVAYLLFLEEEPWIGVARPESMKIERLAEFPERWAHVPPTEIEDPASTRINDYVASMEQYYRHIEGSAMPVGLHAWNDRLFLLAKGKANPTNGNTAWHLVEVSKETGKAIRETPLPSRSEHVLLVPATEQVGLFAILEKGAVDTIDNLRVHYLYRPANRAVFFPETRLDVDRPAPLLQAKSAACSAMWAAPEAPI